MDLHVFTRDEFQPLLKPYFYAAWQEGIDESIEEWFEQRTGCLLEVQFAEGPRTYQYIVVAPDIVLFKLTYL